MEVYYIGITIGRAWYIRLVQNRISLATLTISEGVYVIFIGTEVTKSC